MRSSSRWRLAIVAGATLLGASACQARLTPASSSTDNPPASTQPTTAQSAPATTLVAVATEGPTTSASTPTSSGSSGTPGSLAVDITNPITVVGHVSRPVACGHSDYRYVESASATVNAVRVAETVRIARYTGPGSYRGTVTVSLGSTRRGTYAIDAVPATVTVTPTGGAVSFSATTAQGRTFTGSVTWTCSI